MRARILRWLDVEGLIRETLASTPSTPDPELEELRGRVASLEKKLKMTMGSVQASGAQLMGLHSAVDLVKSQVAQASQQATTARSTAESTADGLEGVEEQLAALKERIPEVKTPKPRKGKRRPAKAS